MNRCRVVLPLLLALIGAAAQAASPNADGPYGVAYESYGVDESITTDISSYFNSPNEYVENQGITMNKAPLRGFVVRPDVSKEGMRFPLVVIVHGNHDPSEPSYGGYYYLQHRLASHGFITVSIDEEFLNGASGEMDARAIVLLRHLQLWRSWDQSTSSRYYRRVDLNRIALIGHSRGGEAVAIAHDFNTKLHNANDPAHRFGFNIKVLFAIAPTVGQILAETAFTGGYGYAGFSNGPNGTKVIPPQVRNAAYGILQGSHDEDVRWFYGQQVFDQASPKGSTPMDKALAFIHGANHKHFNHHWSSPCALYGSGVEVCHGGVGPSDELLLPNAAQAYANLYVTAFLKTQLQGENHKTVFSSDYRTASIVQQYLDKDSLVLNNYEEDLTLSTATQARVRNEASGFETYALRVLQPTFPVATLGMGSPDRTSPEHGFQSTTALALRWGGGSPEYRVNFGSWGSYPSKVTTLPYLSFRIGQVQETYPNWNSPGQHTNLRALLEFADGTRSSGVRVSNYRRLIYPDVVGPVGTAEESLSTTVMSTVRIPFADLMAGAPRGYGHADVRKIVFRFDQDHRGWVVLDDIAMVD